MSLIQETADCTILPAVIKRKKRTLYITKLSRGARGKRAKGRSKNGKPKQFRGRTYLPIKFTFTESYNKPVSDFMNWWAETLVQSRTTPWTVPAGREASFEWTKVIPIDDHVDLGTVQQPMEGFVKIHDNACIAFNREGIRAAFQQFHAHLAAGNDKAAPLQSYGDVTQYAHWTAILRFISVENKDTGLYEIVMHGTPAYPTVTDVVQEPKPAGLMEVKMTCTMGDIK